ncbi:hypothetical protein BT96DRAFT_271524 [Gymnopus androsaceus JB14]|uniref:F-box domain-containing protein n=1 Tax=Gymnopus androsaceus JB14 TaxID=1447944 RepID=A0A6A4H2Z3_9AGAR|nr:hypothetical protein BT96DRAFT_271524 [Gymnopus androsaceus JB14]
MDFPPELEREIFRFAMRSDPSIVPTLKRVAHRVRIWADEVLNEYVLLDNWERTEGDLKHGLGPVPGKDKLYAGQISSSFAKNVFSLCLTYNHELSTEQLKLFASCKALSQLALWVDFSERPEFTAVLVSLPLQRLSLEIEHFMRLSHPPSYDWASRLTHLELVFWSSDIDSEGLSFVHLPSLQHICFVWGKRTYPSTVTAALDTCVCLRTLVILTASGQWSELKKYKDLPEAKGVNIVLLPSLRQATYEWIPGGSSVWDRVQESLAPSKGLVSAEDVAMS